jgi:predicted component of type VI protein secretion system
VVPDAALRWTTVEIVLCPVSGKQPDGSIVHVDGEIDSQDPLNIAENSSNARVNIEVLRRSVELTLRRHEWIGAGLNRCCDV